MNVCAHTLIKSPIKVNAVSSKKELAGCVPDTKGTIYKINLWGWLIITVQRSHFGTNVINPVWDFRQSFRTLILKAARENRLVVPEKVVAAWQNDLEKICWSSVVVCMHVKNIGVRAQYSVTRVFVLHKSVCQMAVHERDNVDRAEERAVRTKTFTTTEYIKKRHIF